MAQLHDKRRVLDAKMKELEREQSQLTQVGNAGTIASRWAEREPKPVHQHTTVRVSLVLAVAVRVETSRCQHFYKVSHYKYRQREKQLQRQAEVERDKHDEIERTMLLKEQQLRDARGELGSDAFIHMKASSFTLFLYYAGKLTGILGSARSEVI